MRQTPGMPLWQRDYYEHVIRDEDEWNRIREYIAANPARWTEDVNNPAYSHEHQGRTDGEDFEGIFTEPAHGRRGAAM